jgi:hypothetical protein
MNRAIITLFVIAALNVFGQDALYSFTNRTDELLQAQLGIRVNAIQISSSTNSAIRYTAFIHHLLQQAADEFDATNHSAGFEFPSVFRPQFSCTTNDTATNLTITNWTAVTDDIQQILARPFWSPKDSNIQPDDNVWGIPFVVGHKANIPNFNEYSYVDGVAVNRKLLFNRHDTSSPPFRTNLLYTMSASNALGVELMNSSTNSLQRDATIYITNFIQLTFTNESAVGTNITFTNRCVVAVASNAWKGIFFAGKHGLFVPLVTNTVVLPRMLFDDYDEVFVASFSSSIPPIPGTPEHRWILNQDNHLCCSIVDDATGRVLDYVNLGCFSSQLDVMQALSNAYSPLWDVSGANSTWTSPPSLGVLNQIQMCLTNGTIDLLPAWGGPIPSTSKQLFTARILGIKTDDSLTEFQCPLTATALAIQSLSWQTANPASHYVLEDLTQSNLNQRISGVWNSGQVSLGTLLTNSNCTIGKANPARLATSIQTTIATNGAFHLGFSAAPDAFYTISASTDLLNWSDIGIATQAMIGVFTFDDPIGITNQIQFYRLYSQ